MQNILSLLTGTSCKYSHVFFYKIFFSHSNGTSVVSDTSCCVVVSSLSLTSLLTGVSMKEFDLLFLLQPLLIGLGVLFNVPGVDAAKWCLQCIVFR